jgi:DNA-binding response OmpR family regulator
MQVLVNEDDLPTRAMLRFVLEKHGGHQVSEVESAERALALLNERPFDLLVTDLLLPGLSGLELVRRVRRVSSLPIIVVSGCGEIADRVRALRTGADDYVVKPFDPAELAARAEALFRRSRMKMSVVGAGVVRAGDLSIDLARNVVTIAGRGQIRLTPTEARVLLRLAHAPGDVHTRAELAEAVWGADAPVSPAAINTYIADLRRKLEGGVGSKHLLQTVRGAGYRLAV